MKNFLQLSIRSGLSIKRTLEYEIKLINISRGGALIETQTRVLPGASISLRIDMAEAVHIVKGRILRSHVHEVGKIIAYRSAIAFDEDFTIFPSNRDVD